MHHFYASIPEDLRALSEQQVVDRYEAGAGVPASAIAGLSGEALRAFPVSGTWSIHQIVVHLMDSDLIASYRMKRIIAEDEPALDLYDETCFAQRLHYHEIDVSLACDLFRQNRLATASILRMLDDETFARIAHHPEVGRISLGDFTRIYILHVEHHLRFIRQKRQLLGTPVGI